MTRVLIFTPSDPVPCHSGAQRRILELLFALRELGAEVHMTGCGSLSAWRPESIAWLKDNGLSSRVSILPKSGSPVARVVSRTRRFVRRRLSRLSSRSEPLLNLATPAMRAWFKELLEAQAFDHAVIQYAWYGSLVLDSGAAARPRSILESQDLVTVNDTMRRSLDPHIGRGPVFSPGSMPEDTIDLRFYDRPRFEAHASEFRAIDRFDATLAITEADATVMRAHTRHTQVFSLPTPAIPAERRAHGPLALLPMGPHPFNLQGYAWFLRKVMPLIRAECPEFQLGVTGILYRHLKLERDPQVRVLGFIDDPGEMWKWGRMLVNPVFGGTGQPIKTIEAMAAGLAPVVLERFARAAPITHGVNGFVAGNESEFAHYCVLLWKDPARCTAMGALAMEAVRNECSREKFTRQLQQVLGA